jgi:hypothetical protein
VARVRGGSRASRLLRRMLRRGISRYHPSPLRAIEEAGAPEEVPAEPMIEVMIG